MTPAPPSGWTGRQRAGTGPGLAMARGLPGPPVLRDVTAMRYHQWEQVQEASHAVRSRWPGRARVGLILGTGLGALAGEIAVEATIPYPEIPHFPRATVESHRGQLVCGTLGSQAVAAMDGRFHLY